MVDFLACYGGCYVVGELSLTPLEMIAEWRKGCSCSDKEHPEECHECTLALIDAIERHITIAWWWKKLSKIPMKFTSNQK